ncbi:MAG TPA: nitroreductase family protein [Terriglobales bacterium]
MDQIGLFEAMESARALRRFKPDPVSEELLTRILRAAVCAPSAGNAQNWIFMVVRDPELRRGLGAIYRRASEIVAQFYAARSRPAHMSEEQYRKLMSAGSYLWEHMGDAPVLLVPCLKLEPAPAPAESAVPAEIQARYQQLRLNRLSGASIYPAVQNIILSCRGLGLATLITTNHTLLENEVSSLLNLPENVRTYALMPIGYPVDKFGPLSRRPVDEVAFADRYGNAWPGDSSHPPARQNSTAEGQRIGNG